MNLFISQDAEESKLQNNEDKNIEEHNEDSKQDASITDPAGTEEDPDNRIYLDLIPVRSFLHTASGGKSPSAKETPSESTDEHEDPKEVHRCQQYIVSLFKMCCILNEISNYNDFR